jgi:Holliday junction resolvase
MTASQYEREIKGILEGDNKTISKITKSCSVIEKNNYNKIYDKPFIVIRAAGSFGIDLVAVRGDISFLLEVKSSIQDTIHFSSIKGKLQKQAITMQKLCEQTRTLPIYAYRIKNHRGDSWKLFTLDIKNIEGRLKLLHNIIPKLEGSKKGYYIMRWKEGLSLSDFILYLCR